MTDQNTATAAQAEPLESRVKALLIAGGSWYDDDYEKRFSEDIERFNSYLRSVGIEGEIINGDDTTEGDLLKRLTKISESEEIDTLVLVYDGHGGDNTWGIKKDVRVSYEKICDALQLNKSGNKLKVILIAENCCAGELHQALEKYAAFPDRVLLYAACGEKSTHGGFINSLIEKITGKLVYDRYIKNDEPYIIRAARYLGLNYLLPRLLKEPQPRLEPAYWDIVSQPRLEFTYWHIVSKERKDVLHEGHYILAYGTDLATLTFLTIGYGPIVAGNLELEKVLTNNKPVFSG